MSSLSFWTVSPQNTGYNGGLCVFLHRWYADHGREKEGLVGADKECLSECAMDTQCHTQRSVSSQTDVPWTTQGFDRCYQRGQCHESKAPESKIVFHILWGAEHSAVLFHSEARCLSRQVLTRIFELRDVKHPSYAWYMSYRTVQYNWNCTQIIFAKRRWTQFIIYVFFLMLHMHIGVLLLFKV